MRRHQPTPAVSGSVSEFADSEDEPSPGTHLPPRLLKTFCKQLLSLPFALCLLLLGTAFLVLRGDRGPRDWRTLAREWPGIAYLKAQLQWLLRGIWRHPVRH